VSQLSEYRRKVLKKSQEELSAELGYEKWQTYAAQEQGKNPLPLDIKGRLTKKYKFNGAWPDEERGGQVTRKEFTELQNAFDALSEAFRRHIEREPGEAHPQARV